MPVVDIKGVGKAQFPDGMSVDDIREFLRRKYIQQISSGESSILQAVDDVAAPYNPSLVEKAGHGIASALKSTGLISDNFQAQQIGKNLTSIGEFLPIIGDATAGDEFGAALAKGDKLGMAMAGLGIIPVAGDLAKNALKVKFPTFKIGMSENADNIILDKVIVPDNLRNSGQGTEFMNDLINNADSKGKAIGLTPSSDFGGNKKRLTEFYKRFGFVENKGKNKDFTISESMIRPAKQQSALPMGEASKLRPTGKPIMDDKGNAKFIEADDGKFFKLHKRSGEWVDITGTVGEANARATSLKASNPTPKPVQAQTIDEVDTIAGDTDYRVAHTAPVREGMNTIDDLSDAYPDDIYNSAVAGRFYGHGGESKEMDNKTARIIAGFRGKPEKEITIYRAVPKGVKDINKGDWITINKDYATSHGDSWVDDGNYDVISRKVKAKDIATDGNSIHEFGYDPVN